ncbi:MAG: MFS transporter [Acidisphaera sp.]|nr:MFS transporter [Acidisphaera sp.]
MFATRLRWMMASLLFLAGLIQYLDRSALSVAAPLVVKDLQLDPAQLGIVFSSFFFGYALFCFVGGWSADKLGGKAVLLIAMTVWSVFCGLTAAATGIVSLLIYRVFFGVGEGPFSATANKLVSGWFPRREQASAVAVCNAGTPLGGALAGPVVGFIAVTFGWRVSFIVIALIGVGWVVLWSLLATSRAEDHPRLSAAERELIVGGREAAKPGEAMLPLSHYLRRPAVLATAFAFFGYAYILYFFLSWFPSYLTMAQHLTVQKMSVVTVIPWTVGFIGLVGGGFLTDAIFRRTGDPVFARKLVLVGCLLIAAVCVALAGLVASAGAAVLLMAVSVLFMYLTGNTYWAIILDTVEPGRVGGVGGFVHLIANCAGIVAPAVTGFLVQATGAFTSAFVLAGGMAVVGALLVAAFVRRAAEPVPATAAA